MDTIKYMNQISPNILLFGSCQFSRNYLEKLLLSRHILNKHRVSLFHKIGVVHSRNSLSKSPLLEFCRSHGITTYSIPENGFLNWKQPYINDYSSGKLLGSRSYDIAIVASFDHYIPSKIVNSFPLGAFNVHPSLLPKYRGASPMQSAIANMDKTTGVSIVTLSQKHMDRGKIITQSLYDLDPDITFLNLSSALAEIGAKDTVKILQDIDSSMLNAYHQDETSPDVDITAPKFDSRVVQVDFETMTARQIYAIHRAYSYIYNISVEFYSMNKREWLPMRIIEILNPDFYPKKKSPEEWEMRVKDSVNGGVFMEGNKAVLWVKCAQNTWLPCKTFRIEGKFLAFDARNIQGYGIRRCTIKHFRGLNTTG